MENKKLQVRDLTKIYSGSNGDVTAVSDVNLDVADSEFVMISRARQDAERAP